MAASNSIALARPTPLIAVSSVIVASFKLDKDGKAVVKFLATSKTDIFLVPVPKIIAINS
jgi:hypothetical protein